MSEKKQKVPKLRFPGFTGEWEQRKLCEVAEITMGQSPSSKNYTDNPEDFILVQGNADLKNGAVVPRLWTKEVTKTAEANSIILTVRAPVGEVAISGYDVVLGRGVAGIKGNDFLYYVLLCLKEFHYWEKLSSGSTFDSINSNDIKEILINMPDEKEQEVITSQLKNIDNLIILHLHKLENLKLKKKALLQKLFPKNGMQFPELRFPGFTDAWEQRKFMMLLKKLIDYRGKTPKKLGETWSKDGHLALSAINVKMGHIDKTVETYYGDDNLYNKWMQGNHLYKGQVLMTMEAPMGNIAQIPDDEKYILSQRTIALVPNEEIIDDFLATVLMGSKFQGELLNKASGGTAKGVSQKTLNEILITIPTSRDEQYVISRFMKVFDNLITLHQRKLEHLQLQKKALLQQMFV